MKKVLLLSLALLVMAPLAYTACNTLDILDEGLGGWTVGTPGSLQLSAWGGTPPYTWTVTSGSFAPGVTMTSGGLISGTPTAAGYYFVCVKVTDSAGCTLTRCYFQEVN
jgi:hypothetical protein